MADKQLSESPLGRNDAEVADEAARDKAVDSPLEVSLKENNGLPSNEEDEEEELEEINEENNGDEPFDDDNDIVAITSSKKKIDSDIIQQREEILQLLQENKRTAKEGDKMYIIPTFWQSNFFNPDIDDSNMLGPIDTTLICRDYDNFVLKDYDKCPYISIPETVFVRFVQWYGLSDGSQPVQTNLIFDKETNSLVTEYNRCFFKIHYLHAPEENSRSIHNRYIDNSNFFTLSSIDNVREAIQKVLKFFFLTETNLNKDDINFKIWLYKDPSDVGSTFNNNPLMGTYLLNPMQFLAFPTLLNVKSDMFDEKIRDLDVVNGSFIIEVKQKNKNYHWPSNYFHYNKLIESPGTIGLSNLGNTCFMNSALQCLVHIPQLRDYFLYDGFEREINTNNPLGYKGYIAVAFHDLIQNLFSERISNSTTCFSPSNFKSTIGNCNSMFAGYMQQDSQEFLAFILDGLHEDLNRIIQKPYVEKPSLPDGANIDDNRVIEDLAEKTWNAHLLRNDSIITDLFVGMYKSTLECPECNNVSVTFDPYSDITLPLPVDSAWHTKIRVIPQNLPPCIIEVELPKNSTYNDLKNYVAKCVNMDVSHLYGCEIFSHQIYNNFEDPTSDSQYLPLQELISESDIIVFYEIQAEEGDLIVPVLNTVKEEGYSQATNFGVPFFIVLKENEVDNLTLIERKLEKCFTNLSGGYIPFQSTEYEMEHEVGSFPLLLDKYQEDDLKKYEHILKYAVPATEDRKRYFNIKILPYNSGQHLRNFETNPPRFWTPKLHMNLNNAKDISSGVKPIIRDIFNYSKLQDETRSDVLVYDTDREQQEDTALNERTVEAKMPEGLGSENVENHDNSTKDYDAMDIDDGIEEMATSLKNEKEKEQHQEKSINDLDERENIENNKVQTAVISSTTMIICEWPKASADEAFSEDKLINWERPGLLPNKELEKIQMERSSRKDQEITLNDCLYLFSKKEVLSSTNSWYCPNCKEHREATKRIQLWSTPDIMLIHLKRFESVRSFSDKIDTVVHFPITNLDMQEHLVYNDDTKDSIYDLIAVDNHYGGLGGGHYTAYVKNFTDRKWYYFDDSRVSASSPEDSVTGAAYLLFYLRRGSLDDNRNEKLREIIESSRMEHESKLAELYENQSTIFETNKTESESETESEDDQNGEEPMEISESSESDIFEDVQDKIEYPSPDEAGSLKGTNNDDSGGSVEEVTDHGISSDSTKANSLEITSTMKTFEEGETNVSVSREMSNSYSTQSLEVGHLDINDIKKQQEINLGRRKKRLIKKVYSNQVSSNSEMSDTVDNMETNSDSSLSSHN